MPEEITVGGIRFKYDGWVLFRLESKSAYWCAVAVDKLVAATLWVALNAQAELAKLDFELTATPRGLSVFDALMEERKVWFANEAEVARLRAVLDVADTAWLDSDTHPRHGYGSCPRCDAISNEIAAALQSPTASEEA